MRFGMAAAAAAACVAAMPAEAATITFSFTPNVTTNFFEMRGCCAGDPQLTQLSIIGAPAGVRISGLYGRLESVIADDGTFDLTSPLDLPNNYSRWYSWIRLTDDQFQHPAFTVVSYTISGSDTFLAAPEPATWALMILGLGAAGVAMRSKRERRPFVIN